jgi:hypothetical protein
VNKTNKSKHQGFADDPMDHCKQQQLLKPTTVHTRPSLYEAQTALVEHQ